MKTYYCIVENNVDPEKIGKVQIRIFGDHPENRDDDSALSYIPTTDLPWAECLSPVTSENISGMGEFNVPANGSLCIGTYLDKEEQRPLILGTLPKIVETLPDFTKGFSDPNEVNPPVDMVGESQISRLARNENIDQTIIQTKIDGVETGVDCNGTTWDEPITQYATEYPKNRVIETEAGHIIEIDNTTDAERIHIYHMSGTSDEFHPNGDKVEEVKNDSFKIVISDENVLVKGDKNIRVEGSENVEIVVDQKTRVGGARTTDVVGVSTENVGGNIIINSTGGKLNIKNSANSLYDLLTDLITKTKAITTFGGPTNQAVDGASQTALASVQTKVDATLY